MTPTHANPDTYTNGVAASARRAHFANPAVLPQSWYVVARSREVRPGAVVSCALHRRRVALYRDLGGRLYALDARCAHIGADLGHGTVVGDEVRCAFHHWRFGPDGACRAAPGLAEVPKRRLRAYPVEERWGLVWLFNGPQPLFPLPDAPTGQRLRVITLPSLVLRCHPHLVLANGLDGSHFDALHEMTFAAPPALAVEPPYRITLSLRGSPRSPWRRWLCGSSRGAIAASFTTIGASVAWTAVSAPQPLHVLFTGVPTAEGHCRTRTLIFLPRTAGPVRMAQAAALLYVLLKDDQRLLADIDFFPGFTDADPALRAFAELVNGLEVW